MVKKSELEPQADSQGQLLNLVNGVTLNFVALYISSILESLNFLGPGC